MPKKVCDFQTYQQRFIRDMLKKCVALEVKVVDDNSGDCYFISDKGGGTVPAKGQWVEAVALCH